jgi:hypothetical protein
VLKICVTVGRMPLRCYGTRAETRFRLSAKGTSPFKSAVGSVQSTTGSRGVRISGSNARYTMFRGSAKSTGYPLHSPVSPSLPLLCVTVCHHVLTGLYPLLCPQPAASGLRISTITKSFCLVHFLVAIKHLLGSMYGASSRDTSCLACDRLPAFLLFKFFVESLIREVS